MASKRTAEQSNRSSQPQGSRATSPALSRSETSSGSKASTPSETRSQIDFQFLNFSHPSEAKASRARRTVRSHVTRQQHQKEQRLQQERRARSYQGPSTDTEPPAVTRAHADTFPVTRPSSVTISPTTANQETVTSSPEASSASPSPTRSPSDGTERRVDQAELYPASWLPYVPAVMEHYFSTVAVDIPGVPEEETAALMRTRFYPFIMSDPASLTAVMLMAATCYTRVHGTRSTPIDTIDLRGMAISQINRSLEDQVRATSDQLIAAVAMMASFEVLFGDRRIFNTHMVGLLRIVSLRGGLPGLGLDGLLEKILLWIDANASQIAGTHLYFDKVAFPTRAAHPVPDVRRFADGVVR